MYQSHVVEGRIMELREDRVVTVQGDTVSTYSLRYYMLAGEEDLEAQASVREPIGRTFREYGRE
ncbi:hypothetical protein [Paenibacillus sp. CAA11]|uniref:hypothetical protein n=1 Tax=Paenibacillus sp. CAA11 TaxID=1532905 RepID=UPI00131F041F|nr:hypothetical protein [Paenibacillus sp. CAA11]